MKRENGKTIRCAIYTRVSSDAGLEQDFNSLDAQHEPHRPISKVRPMPAGPRSAPAMTMADIPGDQPSALPFSVSSRT